MSAEAIIALAGQFGPMGLFIGYLIWREERNSRQQLAYNKERLEADKGLAASLATLAAVIGARN